MPTVDLVATYINYVLNICLGLIGIGFVIGFHELGHFLFCKLFNVKTPSFSIGMGPRVLQKRIGETDFVLSAIPLGGYVEIAGAAEVGQGDQAEASRADERSFSAKPYYQKFFIMMGGILFNFIFAYAALSALFYIGVPEKHPFLMPYGATTVIEGFQESSPAASSGLQIHDRIIAVNGLDVVDNVPLLGRQLAQLPNQAVQLTIERENARQEVEVLLGTNPEIKEKSVGYLGARFVLPKSFTLLESIKKGIATTNALAMLVVRAIKNIFVKRDTSGVGGPLMLISQTVQGASKGFKIFLFLLAYISVNLALLNLIPLPIFDGGQLLFYTIEAVIGRKLPDSIREYIHVATWIILLILMAFLTIKDLWQITCSFW
jgi:regulator of sigma E protease